MSKIPYFSWLLNQALQLEGPNHCCCLKHPEHYLHMRYKNSIAVGAKLLKFGENSHGVFPFWELKVLLANLKDCQTSKVTTHYEKISYVFCKFEVSHISELTSQSLISALMKYNSPMT